MSFMQCLKSVCVLEFIEHLSSVERYQKKKTKIWDSSITSLLYSCGEDEYDPTGEMCCNGEVNIIPLLSFSQACCGQDFMIPFFNYAVVV